MNSALLLRGSRTEGVLKMESDKCLLEEHREHGTVLLVSPVQKETSEGTEEKLTAALTYCISSLCCRAALYRLSVTNGQIIKSGLKNKTEAVSFSLLNVLSVSV